MTDERSLPRWRLALGVLGLLAWSFAFPAAGAARGAASEAFISGYLLGFLVPLAGYIALEFAVGRGGHLVDDHPLIRCFSLITLSLIVVVGAIGLAAEVFVNTGWRYGIGALAGNIAMGIGVLPIIRYDYTKQHIPAAN